MSEQTPELSEQEIERITCYSRTAYQEKILKSLGIPCRRRRDNTLLVLRRDVLYPASQAPAADRPRLKSSRK